MCGRLMGNCGLGLIRSLVIIPPPVSAGGQGTALPDHTSTLTIPPEYSAKAPKRRAREMREVGAQSVHIDLRSHPTSTPIPHPFKSTSRQKKSLPRTEQLKAQLLAGVPRKQIFRNPSAEGSKEIFRNPSAEEGWAWGTPEL